MMWLFANAMSKTVLARYACVAKFNNVNLNMTLTFKVVMQDVNLTMTLIFKVVMQQCQSHNDLDI